LLLTTTLLWRPANACMKIAVACSSVTYRQPVAGGVGLAGAMGAVVAGRAFAVPVGVALPSFVRSTVSSQWSLPVVVAAGRPSTSTVQVRLRSGAVDRAVADRETVLTPCRVTTDFWWESSTLPAFVGIVRCARSPSSPV